VFRKHRKIRYDTHPSAAQQEEQPMKRIRAQVEITRRTSVEFEIDDDFDDEEIKDMAIHEAELAEWDEDPAEVVSFEILEDL
jgi:hypothetical protein